MSLLVREGLGGKRGADLTGTHTKEGASRSNPFLPRKGDLVGRDKDKNARANFPLQQPTQRQVVLDGAMDGYKIHVHLQLVDREKFLLVTAHTRQVGPEKRATRYRTGVKGQIPR